MCFEMSPSSSFQFVAVILEIPGKETREKLDSAINLDVV
jgi:hypothetical protein